MPDESARSGRFILSHGMLEDYIKSPSYFVARHLHKTCGPPPPSHQMRLGTAVHALVFRPEEFGELCAIRPDVDGRTREGKGKLAEFTLHSFGKTTLTSEEYRTAQLIAREVLSLPAAVTYLQSEGQVETTLFCDIAKTRITLRATPDKLIPGGKRGKYTIVDLKTTSDPRPDQFSIRSYRQGYHRQMAFYTRVIREVYGAESDCILIAASNVFPHDVYVYQMSKEFLAIGERQVRRAINGVRRAIEYMDYLAPAQRSVQWLRVPPVAIRSDIEEPDDGEG